MRCLLGLHDRQSVCDVRFGPNIPVMQAERCARCGTIFEEHNEGIQFHHVGRS